VAYAHQNLVIHRDIKPSNVLVTAQGKVCLLDFGIARIADEASDRTHSAYRALTPGYAAPEQFSGAPAATTMDVHGLGALLHALLLGTPPGTASAPNLPPQRVVPGVAKVPGDLRAILSKALATEPALRFDSVGALREDLQAWLEQRPVQARRGSRRYRLGRFIARHRAGVIAALFVLASLLIGLGGTLWQAQRALRAAHDADRARERAEASRDFLARLFRATLPTRPAHALPDTAELLAEGARRALRVGDEQRELGLDLATTLGAVYVQRRMTAEADPLVERALVLAAGLGDAEPALFVRAHVLAALRAYLDRDFTRAAEQLAIAATRTSSLPEHHAARLEFHHAVAWLDYAQQRPEAAAGRLAPIWQRIRARDDVDPDDAIRLANTLAVALDSTHDAAAASEVYDDVLRIAEQAYGRVHMNWAIPAVNTGSNAFNRGDFARAHALFAAGIEVYDEIRSEPMEQRATARSLQGLAWLATGDLDAAATAIRRAREEWAKLRGAPDTDDDPILHYRLGMVDAARGDWAAASAAYHRALGEVWPAGRGGELAKIDVAILLADAQCAQRDVNDGRISIDGVRARIAAAPDSTDARWLAWLEQASARCALAADAPDAALASLDVAARFDPRIARGHIADRIARDRLRALALERLGRRDAALAVRERAAKQLRDAGLEAHPVQSIALLVDR
jgi:tetratricopeptide (TPR) repeat protein